MSKTWLLRVVCVMGLWVASGAASSGVPQNQGPQISDDLPIWLVGSSHITGERLPLWEATFSNGPVAKDGPLGLGEKVTARALQTQKLERMERDGVPVLYLSRVTRRADTQEVVARSSVYLDEKTLLPLAGRIEQGGRVTEFDYDWDKYVVRESPAPTDASIPAEISFDIAMLEAGAHEVWMAALAYDDDFAVRIPSILAGGGGFKFWAVPRVLRSEMIDIGDGEARDAWVVALDWWGMGQNSDFYPGEGTNGTAGSGGMYWILKDPPAGVPPVVRIRTERNAITDSVVQMQDGAR